MQVVIRDYWELPTKANNQPEAFLPEAFLQE